MSLSLTKKQTKKDHACINPFKAAEKVCTSQEKVKKTLEQKTVKAFSPRTYLASPHTAALENSAYTEILPQILCLHVNEQKALSLDVALQGLLRRLIKCL